jgi:1-acyl-sn-glycerol-3-phosphate acyltransferase
MRPESGCGREPLVEAIVRFLAHERAADTREIRACLERAIDEAGPGAIDSLSVRLAGAGADWSYYPRDPLARRIHHELAPRVLRDPVVSGIDHLAELAGRPVVIFANHLSYSDANVLDVVLQNAGAASLADRLTVAAGPKVYSSVTRRFSSLCFGTIKVPQNTERSSDEAVMHLREVARAARRSLEIAHERLQLGEALLVFPEGTRSRTGQMQPFLPGTARYLEAPDIRVLPVAITGTDRLFPIGAGELHPVPIGVSFGRPMGVESLREQARGDRRRLMDAIGFAVARLLPPEHRGVYGNPRPIRDSA